MNPEEPNEAPLTVEHILEGAPTAAAIREDIAELARAMKHGTPEQQAVLASMEGGNALVREVSARILYRLELMGIEDAAEVQERLSSLDEDASVSGLERDLTTVASRYDHESFRAVDAAERQSRVRQSHFARAVFGIAAVGATYVLEQTRDSQGKTAELAIHSQQMIDMASSHLATPTRDALNELLAVIKNSAA